MGERDYSLEQKLEQDEKKFTLILVFQTILIVIIIASIGYLSVYISQHPTKEEEKTTTTSAIPTPSLVVSTITPSSSPTPTPHVPVQITTSNEAKEYFVPLGSGTTQGSDWTDVPGVVTSLDFSHYDHIKEVHFEASVYVPTANESVWVRLYNVTDKHPVWNSEIEMTGGSSAYLTSPSLSTDSGTKLYQVQMKTQLPVAATLVQSKIHISL
ncbi:MAG TPA: hypothetical protein VG935_02615 [Patescibacteria group bacterium]|nr:hypothetical protein [Patescibacteria group bacterium]